MIEITIKIRDSLKKSRTLTGRVCGTYPANDIKGFIGSKLPKNFTMSNLKSVKKDVLCQLLIKIFLDSDTADTCHILTAINLEKMQSINFFFLKLNLLILKKNISILQITWQLV